MTLEARKACVRRLYDEVWNAGNLGVADELFADDYRGPMPDVPPGPEGEKRHLAMIRRTFPDLHLAIDEMVAEGDTVVVRGTLTGTDRGGFMGRAPSGRRVSAWGVHSFR